MPNVDNSAWLDDQFAQIDTRVTKEDLPDGSILPVEGLDNLPDADIDKLFSGVRQAKTKPATISFVDPTTNIEHDVEIGRANPDGSPAPPPQPEVESPYPKEIDLQDGGKITFEQTRKGLRATLDSGNGSNPERFYGKDETELLQQIAVGKINATRKIHSMAKAEKLGTSQPDIDPNPPARVTSTGRKLTQDEANQIKLKHATDPVAAMEEWYKLRTGMQPEETTAVAKRGADASIELYLESVAKSFKIARPQYLTTDENMYVLVGAMCKDFLKQSIRPEQVEEACTVLAQSGFWTVKNLVIFFDGLSEAGLLQVEQEDDDSDNEVEEVPQPRARVVAPTPPAQPERIVRTRPGSQAPYGIRQSLATSAPVDDLAGPSDAELDNLSDEQITQLFSGVRRFKLGTRR